MFCPRVYVADQWLSQNEAWRVVSEMVYKFWKVHVPVVHFLFVDVDRSL